MNWSNEKEYSVNDSIWIAAAVMSYEKYYAHNARNIIDYSFQQADIRKRAEEINGAPVEAARTSQWVCGDHSNHTYSYLRAVGVKRRLSFPGEFHGKNEQPTSLPLANTVSTSLGEITVQQLLDFVHKEYAALEHQVVKTAEIDYIGVLNYLRDNSEQPYSNPEASGISEDERARLLDLKQKGQKAVGEMKKMADIFGKMYGLDKCLPMSWLDGSNTKTRKYLWAQLKYSMYADSPVSVSIFVEKSGSDVTKYRISLEIKTDGTDKKMMEKYHSFLEIPLNESAGLVYVSGSNAWGYPSALSGTQDEIKKNVEAGKLKKVQISKYIERNPDETNEYFHSEITKAIEAIIPYYEHVVGNGNDLKETLDSDMISKKGIEQLREFKAGLKNVEYEKNMILYGPPGTGKTYNSAIYAVAICDEKKLEELTDYDVVMARYEELKAEGRIAFTTFHQSYGYEEFIEGIAPVIDSDTETSNVMYKYKDGIFKEFCKKAAGTESTIENTQASKPYVFIIDEINRGNISKIFGELITLIEPTKRKGMPEAMEANLPYTQKPFSVPANVYILGTMNTADRSIALMDTALRRRFQFIEKMPDADVLRKIGADKVEDLDVALMLEKINERITFLYDREHTIGHAFFTSLAKDPSIDKLASIFEKSVIPLLQEYFYEDYQKIQLVLGDNGKPDETHKFIKDIPVVVKNIFKGSVEDIIDLPEKKYELNKDALRNIQSYIEII